MRTLTRREALGGMAGVAVAGCLSSRRRQPLDAEPTSIFRDGLRRHGDRTSISVPSPVAVDWQIDGINTGTHTAAKASPIQSPTGDIIVPGDTGAVTAVTTGGTVAWRAETGPSNRGIHGTPVIANGTVYVGAYDGTLYAFDLETGSRRWHTKLGDAIGSSPAYHDGTLFIAVEFYAPSGSVYAVDAATGRVVWEDSWPTDHPHSTIAVDVESDRLVVGSNDGGLYAWSYPALDREWRFGTDGPIKGPIATLDDSAVFGSWDHRVYRVGLETGALDWSHRTDGKVMSGPGIDPSPGVVYIGSHDGHVYALDIHRGSVEWSAAVGGLVIGCPTVSAESVIVGSYDRRLYAIDRATGDVTWRIPASGWVTSTPLVTEDGIYFTDRATESSPGSLYRVSATA